MKIPEKYRLPAEKKWEKVIKAIDSGEKWERYGFESVAVTAPCGYCHHAGELKAIGVNKDNCSWCVLPKNICSGTNDKSAYKLFISYMAKNFRTTAREQAVIILEYIKKDKI